ncbi:MAG: squalene--hopene cyclase [Planctomycetota bacterium]
MNRHGTRPLALAIACATLILLAPGLRAQDEPVIRFGDQVSAEVNRIYERGLTFLAQSQTQDGTWGGQPGITAICLMAFLARGEDPDFGRYSLQIRRATRNLITNQDSSTGYLGNRMYDHGFAMLALSEAYGAVDDGSLWTGAGSSKQRSIGEALELAVRCAITSQEKNQFQAWRYSPDSSDADTSVSGAVLVGLLAARNAGIEVPDTSIDAALDYFKSMTSTESGSVGYSGGMGGMGESMNRSSIATLVTAIGKRKDSDEYKATLAHIKERIDHQEHSYPFYFRYYMAQALFQGDPESWARWNRETTSILGGLQRENGSFSGNHGDAYATGMALLALALNYRFLPIYER